MCDGKVQGKRGSSSRAVRITVGADIGSKERIVMDGNISS